MNAQHRTHRQPNFSPGQAGEAMWQAMDQLRASFDKRVGTRMGRGDVRAAVLALLSEGPMHGYQIIREIEKRTDGRWKPSAGSVYPTLQMLADEGLVTSQMEGDRKTYSLTDEASDEAHAAAASAPWTTEDDECETSGVGAVAKAGVNLAQAVSLVARSGSAKQHEHAVEALDEARRKIYTILAQD